MGWCDEIALVRRRIGSSEESRMVSRIRIWFVWLSFRRPLLDDEVELDGYSRSDRAVMTSRKQRGDARTLLTVKTFLGESMQISLRECCEKK
jgi:hypothetical protein